MLFLTGVFLHKKNRCGGSGFHNLSFQDYANERAAEVFHIIHIIILQKFWFIRFFVCSKVNDTKS